MCVFLFSSGGRRGEQVGCRRRRGHQGASLLRQELLRDGGPVATIACGRSIARTRTARLFLRLSQLRRAALRGEVQRTDRLSEVVDGGGDVDEHEHFGIAAQGILSQQHIPHRLTIKIHNNCDTYILIHHTRKRNNTKMDEWLNVYIPGGGRSIWSCDMAREGPSYCRER